MSLHQQFLSVPYTHKKTSQAGNTIAAEQEGSTLLTQKLATRHDYEPD
jgi:hypothetical protein